MKTTLTQLSLLALIAASPAIAQDTTTEDTPAEAAQAEDAAPAENDASASDESTSEAPAEGSSATSELFDTGEPVGGETQEDSASYVRETNGDWDIQCLRAQEGEDPCQLYQLLEDEDGNSVAEVSLFKVQGQGQAVAGANFIVPLETLLTQKLTIAVDGGQAKRYDFAFCAQLGCVARVGFTEADINQFKRGAVANVTIVPAAAPEQEVTVGMSLSGFTDSYDSVEAAQ
ncbi:Invasion protein IalB, involved in pathogenesis [Roseivivax halotolerans]|jgi:invasion protein IalB|uniref:Invasion protein IalB, involved in pathogenesis n=1 Tax=Roseivivax halotolerans TaxID=93684 RepID=A0A1I5Z9U1_9RHOB|nr:invasion associated locus B family protein [Roseivivax halotolerans]SFQ52897.1 Invasion protein IalB, involved in pathogenesis [Roseivivax halotolerans]